MALSWAEVLSCLVRREDLSAEAAAWAMTQILSGDASHAQLAAFAVALRAKGESVAELSALADTMLEFCTPIEVLAPAVDIVGSGGDRANTVNVSSMAAIVAAGAGARVVKHGNRSASSACGTADVLEELGVVLNLTPERQQQVIAEVGIGFLFAAHYHPALRHAGVPRKELGIPTTFNFLGPLANPAQPESSAVGVADARMAELMAGVFAARGSRGLVFHGDDGLDELTTTTTSKVWTFADGQLVQGELDPVDLGIARGSVSDLVGGDPKHNAAVVRSVVAGDRGPIRDIVVLNAAAALLAFQGPDLGESLTEQLSRQIAVAEESIDSGSAAKLLSTWVAATQAV